MKKILITLLVLSCSLLAAHGQYRQLSEKAAIHIVTVGPYQAELYSAFGHSGIRVYDPTTRIDYFYNYGVFDFDQPNFYLNFARGFLNYRLAVADYPRVRNFYSYQNRYIHEQVLDLTHDQTQKLFEFLQWNAEPENMHYYYDYFYDNCATRVRDAVETTFGDSVQFDGSYIDTDYTIRDLTDIYLQQQPWGDLGIDICLGLPMDKTATPYMYMFLPDYIEQAFDHATIIRNGEQVPLVKKTLVTYESTPEPWAASTITPTILFSVFALLVGLVTFRGYQNQTHKKWIDITLFSVIGLLGWLLFILWVATDHNAAARNLNLIWAIPLHFPVALWLLKKNTPDWVSKYFLATAVLGVLTILGWAFLPQNLPNSLIAIVILIAMRAYYIFHHHKTNR